LKARKRKTGKLNGNNQKVELKKKSPMEGHQRGINSKKSRKREKKKTIRCLAISSLAPKTYIGDG